MPTYTPTPAGELQKGDKVRPLAAVGPSIPKVEHNPQLGAPDYDAYPLTVDHVQVLGNDRVRVWAHPHGARVSITSPTHYGTFAADDTVEVAE